MPINLKNRSTWTVGGATDIDLDVDPVRYPVDFYGSSLDSDQARSKAYGSGLNLNILEPMHPY